MECYQHAANTAGLLQGEFLDELLKVSELREDIQIVRSGGPILMFLLVGAM